MKTEIGHWIHQYDKIIILFCLFTPLSYTSYHQGLFSSTVHNDCKEEKEERSGEAIGEGEGGRGSRERREEGGEERQGRGGGVGRVKRKGETSRTFWMGKILL